MADRMTILLIGGYIGALALGAYELQRVPDVPEGTPAQGANSLPPLDVSPGVIKSIAAFDAITERPVFSRERQPESPTQDSNRTQTTNKTDEIEGMRLAAVLKGRDSLTVLLEDASGETRILHQDDRLGKWRVSEILDDRVVMESDGRKETLLVHQFNPGYTVKTPRRRPATSRRQITRRPAPTITPTPRATAPRRTATQPQKP